ncbi:MAG TPA: LuxR C-terminal-related transcriptional regulator [Steroidobacteraceae bacterium]
MRVKHHTPVEGRIATQSSVSIARQIDYQEDAEPRHIIATAPAGFGKTSLLRDFRDRALETGVKAAWLTVFREHEDTATFISGVVDALVGLQCSFTLAFHKDAVPGHASGLREFCREICSRLAGLPHRVALFLDDYHKVHSNEAIGVFMEELTHSAPANFQIVLASRSSPNFSTLRLRLDNRLRQLSARELQFRYEEAEQFYRQVHGLVLSPAQIAKIISRTEGWAAGLQLIALALKRSPRADDVIDALSGNFHEITEYLTQYVIDGLDEDLVRFLVDTSVLDRLHPNLCAAVTQDPTAGARLLQMQESNLFLRPLDESHAWFAYHELFRDYLKTRLDAADPARIPVLHQRASSWYAEHLMPDRAIQHALYAGDHNNAAQLVEQFAQQRIEVGGMADVDRWINMIPAELVRQHPRFQVFKCWALCHIGKYHEASEILRALEDSVAHPIGIDAEHTRELKYEWAVLKAVNSLAGDNVPAALESLPQDPAEPSKHMRRLSAMKANVEGACNIFLSRFEDAERALARAYALHTSSGSLNGIVYSLCYLGYVRFLSGSLSEAHAKFDQAEREARALSGKDSFCYALPRALRGIIHDERDEVDAAESLIAAHLTPIEEGAYIGFRRILFLRLARIYMDRGQVTLADEVLHRLLRSCDENYIARTQLLIAIEWARFAMRSGDVAESHRLLQQIEATPNPATFESWQSDLCDTLVARAHCALLAGDAATALKWVNSLKPLAESARRISNLQELLLLEARAAFSLGQSEVAAAALLRAFDIARKTGRIRACADWRDSLVVLATTLGFARKIPEGASTSLLLELMDKGSTHLGKQTPPPPAVNRSASAVGEALSARELVVLQLVARGMQNKQVAAELSISEHTVRWHVRNVLEKLYVTNRTAAVNAARELGLLAQ